MLNSRTARASAFCLTVVCFAPVWKCFAQVEPASEGQDGTYTLHVRTDLLQVPTLVLNGLHGSYGRLKPASFALSIDSGPAFHPLSVRLQGEDPITLAILFDFTTDAEGMFSGLMRTISGLRPGVFSSRDSFSVYASDCQLERVTPDTIVGPVALKESMAKVMGEGHPQARGEAAQPCSSEKRLYDVVARVAKDMALLPGRRVLLVVSDGEDRGSGNDWLSVARYVTSQSITVFGLRPLGTGPAYTHSSYRLQNQFFTVEEQDPFGRLCGSSGGVVFESKSSEKVLSREIERLVSMLRNRYILEFPRPVNGAAGVYALHVAIQDPWAIVRPAGVSFPPRDRVAPSEPGLVPQDTSKMPVVGSRNSGDGVDTPR